MKKIIITLLAAAMALTAGATTKKVQEMTVSAADQRITFVGRTLTKDGSVSFDWSGVYAKISFSGQYIAMKVSDTKKNYYNVWLDKEMYEVPDKVVTTFGTDSTVVLFDEAEFKAICGKAADGNHNVTIQKRTEGEQGTTTIESFTVKGEILQAEGMKPRIIEFIGDSYTCGFGSENSVKEDPFKPETENANKSYAPIIARYFGADYILVAHSGMGIARNYNDNVKGYYMPARYLQTFDMDRDTKWETPENVMKPQISVIYLCTNDFSTSRQPSESMFVKNYITLIKEVKANYGDDYPILCVAGKSDPMMIEYIIEATKTCGYSNVSYVALSPVVHNGYNELGACSHPNYMGHKKKAATLIPCISTMTGWDLEEKPLR